MRKTGILTAAALAAVVVFVLATLPPAPAVTSGAIPDELRTRTVAGAYHVHTTESDGTADREAIAQAAARVGLQFVVFTDHGDGTRLPPPPAYLHGVLCLDGVEISTDGGHYVSLDMRPAPYPLGGEPAAVVEDVRRLGGFGIVAHPASPKPGLGWTDWTAPVDAIEWLNADSEWRDESVSSLARVPLDYVFRPGPALASLFDRPASALARWDALSARRPVIGLAGHDAHGGVGRRADDGFPIGVPGFPSYESSFRTFTTRAILRAPFSGNAAVDAATLMESIRAGRVFTAIDAIAVPAWLDFRAAHADVEVVMGQSLPVEGTVTFHAVASLPAGAHLVLRCGGEEVGRSPSHELKVAWAGSGACRVEVSAAAVAVPWLMSNPIHVLPAVTEPVGVEPLFETALSLHDLDWAVEKDHASIGAVSRVPGGVTLDYRLHDRGRTSQFVAAAASLRPPVPPYDRILLTGVAARPMRVSVQLRFEDRGGERWVKSVYLSPEPRRVVIPTAELLPAVTSGSRPDFRNASSLLFVVDLTNTRPGDAGRVSVSDISFARPVR